MNPCRTPLGWRDGAAAYSGRADEEMGVNLACLVVCVLSMCVCMGLYV